MTKQDLESRAGESEAKRVEDASALYVLGTRYSTGRDVEHDLISAHKWFNLAAMMGHEEARLARAELAREMSAADIAEAQRQARAWLWSAANSKAGEADKASTPIALETTSAPASRVHAPQRGRSLCA
jgi:uncharacterized protein